MQSFAQKPKAATLKVTIPKASSTISNLAHFGQSRMVGLTLHRSIANQAIQGKPQDFSESVDASPGVMSFGYNFSRVPVQATPPKQVRPRMVTGKSGGYYEQSSPIQIPLHPKTHAAIQPKMTISTPGDMYEQEADLVADQVMRIPEPQLQRVCACSGGCPKCTKEKCGHEKLRTKRHQAVGTQGIEVHSSVHEALRSPGHPMDSTTRAFYEPRFGYEFSKVRVHTDSHASHSAKTINAEAYTFKSQIVFGTNRYQPQTLAGRQLLAHELTHVVQQGGATTLKANLPTKDDKVLDTEPDNKAAKVPVQDLRHPVRQATSPNNQSLNRLVIKASVPEGSSSVQRVADKSNPPSNMPCDRIDTGPGGPGGTHVVFGLSGQTLDSAADELIAAEFKAWGDRGRIDRITVDGFASSDGSSEINWRISCNRAEIVKAAFIRLGVPGTMVVTIARGETEEFSTANFPPNRRAVIRVVPAAQPGPNPGCPTTITENTTLTTRCGPASIVIGADNIILDCSGHTLTGSGGGSGFLLNGRRGVRIVNCRVTNFRNGFGLRNSTANTFTNNTSFDNTADGFDLNESPGNTFIQNNARDNPDHGFEFDNSGNNLIVGNTVTGNGDGFDVSGINRRDATPSPNNTFVNNIANSNDETGFRISSDGNTLRGNTANNSTGGTRRGDGFRIEGNSNTLSGNTGSGNLSDDLDVRNNTTGNTCSGNTFGTTNGRCPPDIP